MIVIGHRGAGGLAAENTISSLRKGLEYGADELEFDVRVTSDGQVIGHHDAEIHDASGSQLRIRAHSLAELQQHKPDLTTLEDALLTVNRRRPVIIDIKPDEPTTPILTILEQFLATGWQPQDIAVASFSQHILRVVHAAVPVVPLIVNERWSGLRASYRARQLGTRRISMNQRWLWSGFIRGMRHSGYQLSAYTLNNPDKALAWARYGLYGVITDFPDRFHKSSMVN